MATKLTFKQFFHVWTQQLLGWLTVKFDSIQIDTSHLATEANATANKNAVLNAIEAAKAALQGGDTTATLSALKTAIANIDIDTSNLAKQGSDSTVTLTGVDTKVGDLTDIIEAINGDTVDDIVNGYLDGEAEEIMSIIGDWSAQESES